MDTRDINIWRGQALNLAANEQIEEHGKLKDLDKLFKRGKEIFEKAFEVGFFDWKIPELIIKPKKKVSSKEPKYMEIVKEDLIKPEEVQQFGTLEQDYSDWQGKWKECPDCKENVPAPLPIHEHKKDGSICGYLFDDNWAPMPKEGDNYKVCRRCGELIPKSWKLHQYRKGGIKCGYEFKD